MILKGYIYENERIFLHQLKSAMTIVEMCSHSPLFPKRSAQGGQALGDTLMTEVGQSWPRERREKFVCFRMSLLQELAADFLTPMLTCEWLRRKEEVSLTDAAAAAVG
jgi:hypothetical protein